MSMAATTDDVYVHEVVDYSGIIHDVIFASIVTLPFFDGYTARRCQQLPTQEVHLPYLGVYFIEEQQPSDGDWNAGTIKFIHDMKLGISVQMTNNDPLALELKLNEAYWQIMSIWTDQYRMNLIDTYNPHTGTGNPRNVRIEGVTRGYRRHNWGTYQETPWAELQYEPIIRYRTYYPPGPFDEFERMDVQIVPLREPRGMWQIRQFAHLHERNAWIAANEHRYRINVLNEIAVEYRDIVPRPALPPKDEVQRIIMRYEFVPGEGAKPRPYPPDPP